MPSKPLLTTPRVMFLHSEVRSYRVPIFDLLSKMFDVTFFFMYGAGWARTFPAAANWKYKDLKQIRIKGYTSDVSPGLVTELVKRRTQTDVILSSGLASFSTHISFLLARLLRKKFIIWAEDWVWSHAILFRIAFPYIRLMVRHTDAFVAAGTKTREFLISLGAPKDRITIAPDCAEDLAVTHPISVSVNQERERLFGKNTIVFSYLGRVVAYKNLDCLLRAFAVIEKRYPNARLVIAGDGPFAKTCEQIIHKQNLKQVIWPDRAQLGSKTIVEPVGRERLIDYLHMTDVFILPGRFLWKDHVPCEAWGLILNEAMSLRKPLISTRSVGGAFDLIQNGVNGFQVKEQSVRALVEAMEFFLKHETAINAFGVASRQLFDRRFTYDRMLDGFRDAIAIAAKR